LLSQAGDLAQVDSVGDYVEIFFSNQRMSMGGPGVAGRESSGIALGRSRRRLGRRGKSQE